MKNEKLMFGAAYYPEYMPYDRMDQDFAMMKKAGINTIRIANLPGAHWSLRTESSTSVILTGSLKKRRRRTWM